MDKLEKDEKARIAAQVEQFGPDGLNEVEANLEAAKLEHGKVVPTDLITLFPMPDMKCVSWHSVQSVQEPGMDRKTVHQTSGSLPLSKYVESDGKPLLSHFSYAQCLAAAGGKDDKYDPDDPEMILFFLTTPP